MCCVLALFVFVFNLVLPVSLDCPFVIASSVFSNGYLCICKQLHSGNCLRTMIVFNFKDVLISVFTNGINLIHFSLINVSQLWCNGKRARLECRRSWGSSLSKSPYLNT
jgi:hypothetical protein